MNSRRVFDHIRRTLQGIVWTLSQVSLKTWCSNMRIERKERERTERLKEAATDQSNRSLEAFEAMKRDAHAQRQSGLAGKVLTLQWGAALANIKGHEAKEVLAVQERLLGAANERNDLVLRESHSHRGIIAMKRFFDAEVRGPLSVMINRWRHVQKSDDAYHQCALIFMRQAKVAALRRLLVTWEKQVMLRAILSARAECNAHRRLQKSALVVSVVALLNATCNRDKRRLLQIWHGKLRMISLHDTLRFLDETHRQRHRLLGYAGLASLLASFLSRRAWAAAARAIAAWTHARLRASPPPPPKVFVMATAMSAMLKHWDLFWIQRQRNALARWWDGIIEWRRSLRRNVVRCSAMWKWAGDWAPYVTIRCMHRWRYNWKALVAAEGWSVKRRQARREADKAWEELAADARLQRATGLASGHGFDLFRERLRRCADWGEVVAARHAKEALSIREKEVERLVWKQEAASLSVEERLREAEAQNKVLSNQLQSSQEAYRSQVQKLRVKQDAFERKLAKEREATDRYKDRLRGLRGEKPPPPACSEAFHTKRKAALKSAAVDKMTLMLNQVQDL